MKKRIEILAPAGSYEGMKAAMNAGCDAVYIGGSSFGARAYANNLDENALLRVIDEAHIRDKKLYLTVNTLLKEKELTGKLYSFLEKFYRQGLDAVIVQDVGVMHFIHENFPGLDIHASTQMTLTMAEGANILKERGVTRLVTSRELSLKEIRAIRDNTDLEIETFVHGALCYCYSGQCLMSSIIGQRSGNRGRCAQPCRLPYEFYSEDKRLSKEDEKYLLSPKDINTIEIIPQLIEAGVDSFKIEGRMKRPEYSAAVSHMYRKYVDLYLELGRESYEKHLAGNDFREDMLLLQDVYNRGGFSKGYGTSYHGKAMMSLYRPNHSGVYVGDVAAVKGREVSIKLKEKVHGQDILNMKDDSEEGYEYTLKDSHEPGEVIKTLVLAKITIKAGTKVYRTKNNKLLDAMAATYMDEDKKLGIKGHLSVKLGKELCLRVSYKDYSVTTYQEVVQKAIRQPMTKDKLTAPLMKTGDTLYYFEDLKIEADEDIFVPVAWLNEIRRDAIAKLEALVINSYKRDEVVIPSEKSIDKKEPDVNKLKEGIEDFGITVTVQTTEQFEAALGFMEITGIYGDFDRFEIKQLLEMAEKAKLKDKRFYLSLPQICRQSLYHRLEKELCATIDKKEISGFLVKNFEEIALLKSLLRDDRNKKEIVLNYNMYIYNREAISFWRDKGIESFTAPVELNHQELSHLGLEDCELLVYGYLPLMVSAQCLYESTTGCRKDKGNHKGYLTDRLGKKFFVSTNCSSCYNIIYNGQPQALHKQWKEVLSLKPKNIRLDFTLEDKGRTEEILRTFIQIYKYGEEAFVPGDFTRGHFRRGVE